MERMRGTADTGKARRMNVTEAGCMQGPAALPAGAAGTAAQPHGIGFWEVLSGLNPLQHIPVVGTIYRAVTGDEIPETARNLGSLAVSGIMGGPLGLVGSLAFLAFRKLTGIDPEEIGKELLADIGIGHHAAAAPVCAPMPIAGETQEMDAEADVGTRSTAWSASQLRAYGITEDAGGMLRRDGDSGSDVLNGLLLQELRPAGPAKAGYATARAPEALRIAA